MTNKPGKVPFSIIVVILAGPYSLRRHQRGFFPVTLESFELSNSLIGVILSFEVASVVV